MRRTRHPPPRDRRARGAAARRRLCDLQGAPALGVGGADARWKSNRSALPNPTGGGPLQGVHHRAKLRALRAFGTLRVRDPRARTRRRVWERVSRALPSDAPGTRAFRSRRFGSKRGFRREKRRAFPFDFRFLDSLMVPSLMTMARVWLANGVCRVRSPRRNRGRGHDAVEASRRAAFAQRPELVARRRRRRRVARVLRVRVFRVRFEHRLEDARPLVLRLLGGAAPRQKRDRLPARIRGGPRAGRDPLRHLAPRAALEACPARSSSWGVSANAVESVAFEAPPAAALTRFVSSRSAPFGAREDAKTKTFLRPRRRRLRLRLRSRSPRRVAPAYRESPSFSPPLPR